MRQLQAVLVLAFCALLAQPAPAQAAPANATGFAMVGITRGQTLQINLVAIPPGPCFARLGFQNSNGEAVGPATSVSLQAGESASLPINGNSLASSFGQRVQVRPTVTSVAGIANSCQASAEVFDNVLGVSSVLVPGVAGYPAAPELGMLGVTS